jgi:hypothetical protein
MPRCTRDMYSRMQWAGRRESHAIMPRYFSFPSRRRPRLRRPVPCPPKRRAPESACPGRARRVATVWLGAKPQRRVSSRCRRAGRPQWRRCRLCTRRSTPSLGPLRRPDRIVCGSRPASFSAKDAAGTRPAFPGSMSMSGAHDRSEMLRRRCSGVCVRDPLRRDQGKVRLSLRYSSFVLRQGHAALAKLPRCGPPYKSVARQ